MRQFLYSVLLVIVTAAAFVAGAWHNQRSAVTAAALAGKTVLYYVDPMHPAYKSDKPGIAPDCGMQLEPVYQESADATRAAAPPTQDVAGAVTVNADKQQLIGVRVSAVERASGTYARRLFGRVVPVETAAYQINVNVDGFVREASAVTTGSYVEKDQWLATFSSPDLRQPASSYLSALDILDRSVKTGDAPSQLAVAQASVQLAIDRLLTLGMSPVQLEEMRQKRLMPANMTITAPASGFVTARNISTGQKIEKGGELFRIADLRQVWIVADVFGLDAEDVRAGMRASVSLPSRNRTIPARVSEVLPRFDATSQSLKVRLEADNPGYALRPDMFVDVDVQLPYASTIVIPSTAIVATGLRHSVFVERSPGVFEPRAVETGRRFGESVQILSGLDVGERIVTSGTFLLDSESRMKAHD